MLRRLVFAVLCVGLVLASAGCGSEEGASSEQEDISSPSLLTPGADANHPETDAPPVTPQPTFTPAPQIYWVEWGDSLSSIAAKLGCTVEELMADNGLTDGSTLQPGQRLIIPRGTGDYGPGEVLIPDSEFVYSPAASNFDLDAFIDSRPGYLKGYSEMVDDEEWTGAEIVRWVAEHFSTNPRLLLAMLEYRSGWLDESSPSSDTLVYPMGKHEDWRQGLLKQLSWAADEMNVGYYDWRGRGTPLVQLADWRRVAFDDSLNPGTVAIQRFLAQGATREEWHVQCGKGPGSFYQQYVTLFGDPFQYTLEPLVPSDLKSPVLSLPWEAGMRWYYTSGPHGGWGDGSGWAALDFVPPDDNQGCYSTDAWVVAATDGLVAVSKEGMVLQDLDGDGDTHTGWVIMYLHVATRDRVQQGVFLKRGERLGHPSCEGGFANATHLHIARMYNGEWIAADGPWPLILSGWVAGGPGNYEGTLAKEGEFPKTACQCWDDATNGIVSDNIPER
jgi:LysM repeat protein